MVDDPEHTLPIAENQAVKGRDIAGLDQMDNLHIGVGFLRALRGGDEDFGQDLWGIHDGK